MTVLGPWPHGDPMPLSSHERQRLAEIEARLLADPVFLAVVQSAHPPSARLHPARRTVAASILMIGIVVTIVGAVMAPHSLAAGIIVILVGFVTVVAGAVVWFTAAHPHS